MIDEAVRRQGKTVAWLREEIAYWQRLPQPLKLQFCEDVRAEFRCIQWRRSNKLMSDAHWQEHWLAVCESMKQRYAHTYEVKH